MSTIPFLLLAVAVAAEPSPLAIDKATVDRGEVRANKPLVQTFQLKNTSADAISITDVIGVCGCVRPMVGTRMLGPGESTDLTVGVNLLTQPDGPGSWATTVRFRTAAIPPVVGEHVVRVAAKVRKDVTVEPVALVLSAETEITGTLTVRDGRGKPLTVTGVRLGVSGVTTTVKAPTDAGGKRSQTIEITVTDVCVAGAHADEACIDTDDPEYGELRVPVRIVKKAAAKGVSALPATATLRFAKSQPTASALVRLRDAADGGVVIESAAADHEAVACKWAAGPGTMTTLRVTVDWAKATGPGTAVVTVNLKGPAAETIFIPVSWTGP